MGSLFDVASAGEVPFGIAQYIQCILHGGYSSLLTAAKSVDSVVACDDFLFVMENYPYFHTDCTITQLLFKYFLIVTS